MANTLKHKNHRICKLWLLLESNTSKSELNNKPLRHRTQVLLLYNNTKDNKKKRGASGTYPLVVISIAPAPLWLPPPFSFRASTRWVLCRKLYQIQTRKVSILGLTMHELRINRAEAMFSTVENHLFSLRMVRSSSQIKTNRRSRS